jgi:hypothetical protein
MFATSRVMEFASLQDAVSLLLMVPADALKATHATNTAVNAKIFFIPVLLLKVLNKRFTTRFTSY